MGKDTTLNFFDERRPDAIEYLLPVIPASPNRIPTKHPRLHGSEGHTSWTDYARSIRDCSVPVATFFLDTSFLYRNELPRVLFDAIRAKKVAITSEVWIELQDWVKNPFANADFRDILVVAQKNGPPSVVFAAAT